MDLLSAPWHSALPSSSPPPLPHLSSLPPRLSLFPPPPPSFFLSLPLPLPLPSFSPPPPPLPPPLPLPPLLSPSPLHQLQHYFYIFKVHTTYTPFYAEKHRPLLCISGFGSISSVLGVLSLVQTSAAPRRHEAAPSWATDVLVLDSKCSLKARREAGWKEVQTVPSYLSP